MQFRKAINGAGIFLALFFSAFSFSATNTYYDTDPQAESGCRTEFEAAISGTAACAHDMGSSFYFWRMCNYTGGLTNPTNGTCGSTYQGQTLIDFEAHRHWYLGCDPPQVPGAGGVCEDPETCEYGDLSASCAVDCPRLEYTYYVEGVAKRGSIGAGQVGYGMTCPQPDFPPGGGFTCIGTAGTCTDYATATPEQAETVVEETVQTDDGNGNTTESTTTTTTPGTNSAAGANPGSGGSPGYDSGGNAVDPQLINDPLSGYSNETVDIGDRSYQICSHGGIVDSLVGCDYNPPSCGGGEVATNGECVTIPVGESPDDTPATTTTTTTTDPVTGDVTTTTTKSGGTSGGSGGSTNPKVDLSPLITQTSDLDPKSDIDTAANAEVTAWTTLATDKINEVAVDGIGDFSTGFDWFGFLPDVTCTDWVFTVPGTSHSMSVTCSDTQLLRDILMYILMAYTAWLLFDLFVRRPV